MLTSCVSRDKNILSLLMGYLVSGVSLHKGNLPKSRILITQRIGNMTSERKKNLANLLFWPIRILS